MLRGLHGWDFLILSVNLPQHIRMIVEYIQWIFLFNDLSDILVWSHSQIKTYTTKSTYGLISNLRQERLITNWILVWKVQTHLRIQHFTLCTHGSAHRLYDNLEMSISTGPTCQLSKLGVEDLTHTL